MRHLKNIADYKDETDHESEEFLEQKIREIEIEMKLEELEEE